MFPIRWTAVGGTMLAAGALLSGFAAAQAPQQNPPPKGAPHPVMPTPSPASAPAAPKLNAPMVPGSDIIHFESRIGSFKLLGSDAVPVTGDMTISFDGTVLVSGLQGPAPELRGTVHLEKQTADHLRQVYFGKGEMLIHNAKMRSFQFFGKNVNGTFKGAGIFRLFGEFDKKLETGFIWYDGESKKPWGTGGMQYVCPNPAATSATAKVRIHSAG